MSDPDITNRIITKKCWDAVAWVDELSADDAAWISDVIVDRLIERLRQHSQLASISRYELELFLDDTRILIADFLTDVIDGAGDITNAVRSIVRSLTGESQGVIE
jgi:hypothetical protein